MRNCVVFHRILDQYIYIFFFFLFFPEKSGMTVAVLQQALLLIKLLMDCILPDAFT